MLDVIDLNLEFHDHLVPETVVYHFNLHMEEGDIIATCEYGYPFTAAVRRGNVFGTQFHPEKSGDTGIAMIKNFGGLRL